MRLTTIALLGATTVHCAACAGGPSLPKLPAVPEIELSSLKMPALAVEQSVFPFTSAEAYLRIARGANACWFGATGRLKSSYIFHADAAPSMNGGAVDIVIHERAVDQPKPWGYKAYRVAITETKSVGGGPGGGSSLAVENLRMPDEEAVRMREEVFLWAGGSDGCKTPAPAATPPPAPPAPPPPAVATSKSAAKSTPPSTAAGGAR